MILPFFYSPKRGVIVSKRKLPNKVSSLSATKVKRIEVGFSKQLKVSRKSYLSKEIERYKNLNVVIDN